MFYYYLHKIPYNEEDKYEPTKKIWDYTIFLEVYNTNLINVSWDCKEDA